MRTELEHERIITVFLVVVIFVVSTVSCFVMNRNKKKVEMVENREIKKALP